MSKVHHDEPIDTSNSEGFVKKLSTLVEKLKYPSHTQERIRVIDWQADNPAPFDVLLLKKYLGLTPKDAVFQKKWEEFFEPILSHTATKETHIITEFQALKDYMAAHLEHLQYFQAGYQEVEAYLIGKDSEGKWKGLKTLIVEA